MSGAMVMDSCLLRLNNKQNNLEKRLFFFKKSVDKLTAL